MIENLITIVVAVYNAECTLKKCVDSIIRQTHTDLEIILINDGSSDDSLKLCMELQKLDNRISVYDRINGGLSVVRNFAINVAKGKYIAWVDSDDWIVPEMIEVMFKLMRINKACLVRCDFFSSNDDSSDCLIGNDYVVESESFLQDVLVDKEQSQIWRCLIKKEILNRIVFPVGMVAQDMFVFHEIVNSCGRIVQTRKRLYCYYLERPDNTSNSIRGKQLGRVSRSRAYMQRYLFAKENCEILADACLAMCLKFYLSLMRYEVTNTFVLDERNKVANFLSRRFSTIIFSKNVHLNWKLAYLILLTNKSVYRVIFRLMEGKHV